MKIKSFFAAAILILGASVFAQNNTDKRFALVIGNQSYKESPLSNPVADAKLIASQLKECGFDVTLATDLTQAEMSVKVGEYASKVGAAGSNTISFFYYSGHGVQIDGKNYMVPVDDSSITNSATAKLKCQSIDQVIDVVPSKTQVIVLDACRNNPFKNTNERFSKGLSQISTPRNVENFLTLFSTQAGQTADDGSGRNSLFTECLNERMKEMNTQIITVFNEVADDVKTKTGGRQTPLVTGTSVKFELMNAAVAEAKIKALREQAKKMEAAGAKNSKTYASEKALLDADIKLMNEKKAKAEADAKEKADKQKKEDAIKAKNKKEMERLQKEAEAQKKALQKQKAKQKSAVVFIEEIEDNKNKLQVLRKNCAEKIFAANQSTNKEEKTKIEEINNTPLKNTEKDAKGKITSAAKKARNSKIKAIREEYAAERAKNFDRFYSAIKEEESARVEANIKDEKTLATASYTASSIAFGKESEVEFKTSDYDGEHNLWKIYFNSNIFGTKFLFISDIALTYESFCRRILEQKYVAPDKMSSIELDDYDENVSKYQILFQGENPPLIMEVDYKISPVAGKNSSYKITTSEARLKYLKENEPVLASKSCINSSTLELGSGVELKSVQQLLLEMEKEEEMIEAEAEKIRQQQLKEAERQRKAEQKALERRQKSERQAQEKVSSPSYSKSGSVSENSGSDINWDEIFGSQQRPVEGIQADVTLRSGFKLGYVVPVKNNFFVTPYLGGRTITEKLYVDSSYEKESKKNMALITGCELGGNWTFDTGSGSGWSNAYASVNIGIANGGKDYDGNSKTYKDFGLHFGNYYMFNEDYGVRCDIGFCNAAETELNMTFGGIVKVDFLKEFFK